MQIRKAVLAAGVVIAMSAAQSSAESTTKMTILNPDGLYDPAPNGYSHAVVSTNARGFVHIAGQGGEDRNGHLPADFESQVAQAYANLSRVLSAAEVDPGQVAKINTYVVGYDLSMLPVMTRHVKMTFGDHLPAQTLVPVPRLAIDGMLFEVDAVAILRD